MKSIVIDEDGEPIRGAEAVLLETNIKTITEFDGSFHLRIPRSNQGGVVIISYDSYISIEILVDGNKSLGDIILKSDPCYDFGLVLAIFIPPPSHTFLFRKKYLDDRTSPPLVQSLYYKNVNLNQEVDLLKGLNYTIFNGSFLFEIYLGANNILNQNYTSKFTSYNDEARVDDTAYYFRVHLFIGMLVYEWR